jgi:hypothetical protein
VDAAEAFESLADHLRPRGVVTAQMFGKRSLKYESRAFACLFGDALAVKLMAGTSEHATALALAGAELFDPSGKHRPMKDWVSVPLAHTDRWLPLADTALNAVRSP